MERGLDKSWSNTQFDKFSSCQRRYYYTYVLGRKDLDPAGPQAMFSSMVIHPMLASMYLGVGGTALDTRVDTYYTQFLNAAGEGLSLDAKYSTETVNKVRAKYEKIVVEDLAEYKVMLAEEPLYVYLGECRVTVKPDVVLQHKVTQEFMPLDFKVSGYDKPSNRLQHHTQFVGQAIAAHGRGVFVDSITISKSGKVSTERDFVIISEELKEEWHQEMTVSVSSRNAALQSGIWVKRSESCYSFGQPCPFIAACQNGKQYGEKLL